KNQYMSGLLRANGINILIDGVGGALIPLVAHALHRRKHFNEFAHLARHNIPSFSDVTVKRQRLVLGKNVNPAQVGIHAVRQGYVNDTVNATECDCRFCAVARQGIKTFTSSACQQDSKSVFHCFAWMTNQVPTTAQVSASSFCAVILAQPGHSLCEPPRLTPA